MGARRRPQLPPTLVETAFSSILHPGVNRGTFAVLNAILLALLLSIAFMFLAGLGSVHTYVLLFLTAGLLLSINLYASALIDNSPQQQQPQEGGAQQTQQLQADVRKEGKAASGEEEEGEGEVFRRVTRSQSRGRDEASTVGVKTRSSTGAATQPKTTSGSQKRSRKAE